MKILFVAVFDNSYKSTNNSQLRSLIQSGHHVVGYNFRENAKKMGFSKRDEHLLEIIKAGNFDHVLVSKGENINILDKAREHSKISLWFMDPLSSYNEEMKRKTKNADFFFCDKKNVLDVAGEINKNSFRVCEGYDQFVDRPHNLAKKYDLSFIGSIYGNRSSKIKSIKRDVSIFNNKFGTGHAKIVSQTRINLNLCTSNGASDRVYKVMASGGFLVTDDWDGREEDFTNGEDLIIFENNKDLNEKIDYYLQNPKKIKLISQNGYKKVKKFSRLAWATNITNIMRGLQ